MKSLVILALIVLASACNSKEASDAVKKLSDPEPEPVFTLDERLLNDSNCNERWLAYDAGTNIDDNICVRKVLMPDGSWEVSAYWDSRYRGGSGIHNSEFYLTATSANGASAKEHSVSSYGIGDGDLTYTFTDDDHLQFCMNSGCIDLVRTP